MKAVVYNRFADGLAKQLRAHLEERGVEILFFGAITPEMKCPDGAEVLIVFIELMSHGMTDMAKLLARKWGVKYIPLSRKTSTWSKYIAPPKGSAAMVQERPSLPAASPEEALEDIREVFIAEVEDLKRQMKEYEVSTQALIEAHEKHLQELEEAHAQEIKSHVEHLAAVEARHREEVSSLQEKLRDREDAALDIAAAEVEALREKMRALEVENARLKSESMEPISHAFRTLLSTGFISENEVRDRIYKRVMG